MACWELLPPEIRVIIFEMLARDPATWGETGLSRYALTQYSLVCRDWQFFFEGQLYRHLNLGRRSLSAFNNIVRRQRLFVEHIRLNIDMETYGCWQCARYDLDKLEVESANVSNTLRCLFRILSAWRQDQVSCLEGLTLEICGYPRRDLEGCGIPFPLSLGRTPERRHPHTDHDYRGGLPLNIDPGPRFAQVQVVKKLVVPPESRWRLSGAVRLMIRSLPCLYHKTVIHD
ncbi:hypothetical protein ACHAPT_009552 [Fusarium lateritium]